MNRGLITVSRGRTISYQPGMAMPKFYWRGVSALKQMFQRYSSNITYCSFCCNALEIPPLHLPLNLVGSLVDVRRTTVIGMVGAFGKMKATSSNFPLLRQFSARLTLMRVNGLVASGSVPNYRF